MHQLDIQTKHFEQWLLTHKGQLLFHEEQQQTTQFLAHYPHLKTIVQLGGYSFLEQACTSNHQYIHINYHPHASSHSLQTLSAFAHLPFTSAQTIDAVICPHIHELMVEPSRLYEEIKRILITYISHKNNETISEKIKISELTEGRKKQNIQRFFLCDKAILNCKLI